jgi:hypothetical protein
MLRPVATTISTTIFRSDFFANHEKEAPQVASFFMAVFDREKPGGMRRQRESPARKHQAGRRKPGMARDRMEIAVKCRLTVSAECR